MFFQRLRLNYKSGYSPELGAYTSSAMDLVGGGEKSRLLPDHQAARWIISDDFAEDIADTDKDKSG